MSTSLSLSTAELVRALELRDLTDPARGPHAMQLLLDAICAALPAPVSIHRSSPIVSIADNYDRLGYPPDGAAREARYTRYVCDSAVLRTQTSAMIPPLLRTLASAAPLQLRDGSLVAAPDDVVLACPGLVYRRDVIDRLHVGEPHQLDLWRIARAPLGEPDLEQLVAQVVEAALPGTRWRTQPASHPYTTHGRQIDALVDAEWIEIGECGLASPTLLRDAGLAAHHGLALGLGLDRLLMLRKGIDDIRLLRAADPRIASQLLDLAPYRPVSAMPPVRRDLSIVIDAGDADMATHDAATANRDIAGADVATHAAAITSRQIAGADLATHGAATTNRTRAIDAEQIGDQIRAALGERAALVEAVELVSITPCAQLPPAARARLGIAPHQHNALVRVTLRALDRTLTHEECNELRDAIYDAIHRGSVRHYATNSVRPIFSAENSSEE